MLPYEADRRKWTFNRIPKIGDVYVLELNWITGHSENLMKKVHMLVVLQANFLRNSPLRICAPITSYKPNKSNKMHWHWILKADDYPSFLTKDSVVLVEQLLTINWKKYLADQNHLGTLKKSDLAEILKSAANVLGFRDVFQKRP